jgi:hypothetical protein
MTDNHSTVAEFFLIVDLTIYCINSYKTVIIQSDLRLYVKLHYSNFRLRYSQVNGWIFMINNQQVLIQIYKFIMYYKQRSLLHVSTTYCGRLWGGVIWKTYYVESQNNLQIFNV